jgi:hypothetical protein
LQNLPALWLAAVALEAALLARVLWSFRRLHWFAAALGAIVAQDLILMQLRYGTNAYGFTWIATTAIVMVLQAAAAVEAFSSMLNEYRGIGWAVTALLAGALLVGATAAALLSGPDIRAIHELSRWVSITFAAKRVLSSVLAVFMLCGSFLFWSFRVPHRPNDRRHLMLMTCLLAFYAAVFLAQNLDRKHLAVENIILQSGVCLCMAGWLAALTKAGEIRPSSEVKSIDSRMFQQQNERALQILKAAKRS